MAGKANWKYNPLLDGGVSRANQEDSARDTQAQRDRDEIYANDVNTLAAVFRSMNPVCYQPTRERFSLMLRYVAGLMADGWGAADAQFPQQVFDDHGPGAVLLALKRAYDQPEHVTSDVVEHP